MAFTVHKTLTIRSEKCTGCRTCEAACSSSHYGVLDFGKSRIRMIRNDDAGLDVVTVCVQCDEKPCIEACPVDAITANDDGTVAISAECTRCGRCKRACPYSGPQPDPKGDSYIVCDLCGGTPACVEWCPFEVLEFSDGYNSEEDAKLRRLVEEIETNNKKALSMKA